MSTVVSLYENEWYLGAMEKLVSVVQDLSHARDLDTVTSIVRRAARELTGADGATFVLRDGDQCYYADENAISPLWKGQRFPMKNCVSGWVMINREPAIIEDIYADSRVPTEAYRPTFVKSMVMVPIRRKLPIGAIGNYWSKIRRPTKEEVHILQVLADVTAVAIENANLDTQLKQKIAMLENSNAALGRFAWISSHDLQAPLRAIENISQWIEESIQQKNYKDALEHIKSLNGRIERMDRLLKDILEYAKVEYIVNPYADKERITGRQLIDDVIKYVAPPENFLIQVNEKFDSIMLPRMPLQQVFYNLLNNAVKHNNKKDGGTASVDCEDTQDKFIFTISDNGPGISPNEQEKLFEIFQDIKARDTHDSGGMGLALVKKILNAHGCDITVESFPGRGSIFRFTWPKDHAKA